MANFTPEEINAIIQNFLDTVGRRQYVGARYVPIFGRKGETSIEWDNTAPYEPLTIVLYQGNSYTSRQYVPTGVAITNTDFWVETGNYNAQIEQYREEVSRIATEVNEEIRSFENDMNGRFNSFTLNINETVDELSDMIDLSRFPANAVQIVAHRGAMYEAPENSLLAFNLAYLEGADLCETDVRKSSDGTFFLMHDDTIDRTTNGTGNCSELPWSYLQNLTLIDDTPWAPYNDAQKIPTLDSFLRFMSEINMKFQLEIKDSVAISDIPALVQKVCDYGLQGNVIFISYYLDRLYFIKDEYPSISCFVLDDSPTTDEIDEYASHHIDGIGIYGDVDASIFRYAMDKGLLTNGSGGNNDLTTRQILPNFWSANNIAEVRTMRVSIGSQTTFQYYTNRALYKHGLLLTQYVNYLYSIRHAKVSVPYLPEGASTVLRCQTNRSKEDVRFSDIMSMDVVAFTEDSTGVGVIPINSADAFHLSYTGRITSDNTYFGIRVYINRTSYPLASLRAALEIINMNWELDVIAIPLSCPALTSAPTGTTMVSNPQAVPDFEVQSGVYVVPKSMPLHPWFQVLNKRMACIYALNSNLQRVDGNITVDGDVFPAGGGIVFDPDPQSSILQSGYRVTDNWKEGTKFWPYFDYLLIITDMSPVMYTYNGNTNRFTPSSRIKHIPLTQRNAIFPYAMQ